MSLAFDPARDRLWFVGDLVNRGPDSLGCLRFVKGLGRRGGHGARQPRPAPALRRRGHREGAGRATRSTACSPRPDRDELLDWLRIAPAHARRGRLRAGARGAAAAVDRRAGARARRRGRGGACAAPDYRGASSRACTATSPPAGTTRSPAIDRLRAIVNAMTRLRVCTADGAMDLSFKGEPGEAHAHRIPWFDMPGRANATHTIVCGHWSALGLSDRAEGARRLDSGCVWGRALTAVRLSDRRLCPGARARRVEGRED